MRELLGGMEVKNISLTKGHGFALQAKQFMRRGSNRNTVGFKYCPFSTLKILIKRKWLRIEGCVFQSMKIYTKIYFETTKNPC